MHHVAQCTPRPARVCGTQRSAERRTLPQVHLLITQQMTGWLCVCYTGTGKGTAALCASVCALRALLLVALISMPLLFNLLWHLLDFL